MRYESCLKIETVSKGVFLQGSALSQGVHKFGRIASTISLMKKISSYCIVAFLAIANLCQAQTTANVQTQQTTVPSPTPYTIVSRNADSRVWEQTTYEVSPSGQTISHLHQYTELGTGLCYQQNGQWVDSQELINILPDGSASATNGQHQAYFPSDIYNGTITVGTPDGLQLQSQPVGLFYDDGSNTVMIAALTNSVGELISSNQIIYPNAFAGVNADLLYTYRKSGLEQDIVFRNQSPPPEQFGLNSADTQLQLLTEFFNPPAPVEAIGPVSPQDGLQDTTLTFGEMKMMPGRAFLAGTTSFQNGLYKIPVYKSWATISGRTFLIEDVPYQRISSELTTLPLPSSSSAVSSANSTLRKVTSSRFLPPGRLVEATTNSIHLVKTDFKPHSGLVLDYIINDNVAITNYTFQGDTTYYVSGTFIIYGTMVLEGGTVIKLNGDGEVWDGGPIDCQTGPYRPAIFTSFNDNSVGQSISGSSGSPNFQDVNIFLALINTNNLTLQNVRFCYGFQGIQEGADPNWLSLSDSQFMNVDVPIWMCNINLYNVLFGYSSNETLEVYSNEDPEVLADGNMVAENVTSDSGYGFYAPNGSGQTLALTNCLITSQMLFAWGGSVTLLTNDVVYLPSPTGPVYQTVGAGSYYLTNNSPYRNAGTTNIDCNLLTDLAQKTTYPPIVYSNTAITVDTSLGPTVQRDNVGAPDLGYHYDPLDYVVGGCDLYSNITITTGTAVGFFQGYGGVSLSGQPYGISLNNGANLSFNGSATQPCYFSDYCMVQEGGNGNWTGLGYMGGIVFNGNSTPPYPQLTGNFTKWTAGAQEASFFRDKPAYGAWGFFNCEFYDGNIAAYSIPTAYFTNCLFHRDFLAYWDNDYSISFSFVNCTFYDGCLAMARSSGQSGDSTSFWLTENTAFDGTTFSWSDNFNGATNHTLFNYNAYNTNNLSWVTYPYPYPPAYGMLETNGSQDVLVTNYNWQTSWFGNFYLPPDSPLLNAGSTYANLLGLYHFTTQTNIDLPYDPEGNSTVDIGYHYVATDAYGNPLDSNSDGIPDYIEDANGNGTADSGEIDWNSYYDLGLTVIITQPRNGSTLP